MFYKLGIIAALIAALAAPTSAAGKGVAPRHARAQVACPQIYPGRPYGLCGGKIWVRDPQTGQVKAIPFWRLQRLNDHREDQP
jgi:hypothetical protein